MSTWLWGDETITIASERLGFQVWGGDCSVPSKLMQQQKLTHSAFQNLICRPGAHDVG